MDCDTFRAQMEQAKSRLLLHMPPAVRMHHDTCLDCQAWLQDEAVWQHVFARVPAPSVPSVWPRVLTAIRAHQAQPLSLSGELVAFGRILVPALALLVLILGGVAFWKGSEPQEVRVVTSVLVPDATTDLAFLQQDPDTIMAQWVGISEP